MKEYTKTSGAIVSLLNEVVKGKLSKPKSIVANAERMCKIDPTESNRLDLIQALRNEKKYLDGTPDQPQELEQVLEDPPVDSDSDCEIPPHILDESFNSLNSET